jgi:hypothetical protein
MAFMGAISQSQTASIPLLAHLATFPRVSTSQKQCHYVSQALKLCQTKEINSPPMLAQQLS